MFSGSLGNMSNNRVGGLSDFLSSLFSDPSQPYQSGMDQIQKYFQGAQNYQKPFYNMGSAAIGPYQNMVQKMSNPSQFLNNLMGNYQQSPYAQYLKNQMQNATNNAASASGMLGSTPFLQQSQENAANISGQDMQSWLQNALGINNQAMGGYQNMIGAGQTGAGNLSNILTRQGENMGQLAFGQDYAQNQNSGQGLGGLLSFFLGM